MDANIQKPALRIICLLTVIIILPFLVMHFMRNEMMMVFNDLLILLCSAGVLLFSIKTERVAQALVMQIVLVSGILAAIFYTSQTIAIYWFFPIILVPFYVLTKKSAVKLIVLLTSVLFVIGWQKLELIELAHFVGAMLSVVVVGYRMATMSEDQSQLLKKKAHTDGLTGVGNRLGLDQRLIHYVNKFEVEKMPSTLLMLDIDHYGQMVENYGYGYGDAVVTELAGLLNESTRIDDEVFRYGGDVFVVILRGTSLAESGIPAERISSKINGYKKGRIGNISVNMGLAELEEFDNYISWLSRADEALFDAKEMRGQEQLSPIHSIYKKDTDNETEKLESQDRAPAPKNVTQEN